MIGQGEPVNRFNDFNNMNALPQNRIWYGYQSESDFRTGFGDHLPASLPTGQYRINQLHQMGFEVACGNLCSVVVQAQYVATTATADNADAWADPQILLKWTAIYKECTIVSPVLGIEIQTSQVPGQLHEATSRLQPGVLFMQSLEDIFLLQGALQVSAPMSAAPTTVDYGVSLAWWLYRDDSLDVFGRTNYSWARTALPFVTGVLPMVELWGNNVIAGARDAPFTPAPPTSTLLYPSYMEAVSVYNMTTGFRFLLYNHYSLSLAYSFPLTGSYTYGSDFLAGLNLNF